MAPGRATQSEAPGAPSALLLDVRRAVASHHPVDEREARSRTAFGAALESLRRPFDRLADLEHVTGSAVVAGRRGTVLHLHKRLHRWLQPGGHLEPGETPWDAALREGEEETGLALSHPDAGPLLIHLDVHEAADAHVHLDMRYLLLAGDEDPAPGPAESSEVRWFSWDEAQSQADDALSGALHAGRLAAGRLAADGPMSDAGREESRS